jgi:hypothetical protein
LVHTLRVGTRTTFSAAAFHAVVHNFAETESAAVVTRIVNGLAGLLCTAAYFRARRHGA